MNPKITVYITNYNYGKFIEESINSVLNQTFQDFEIIVIDDGSTDNSKEIIKKFENHEKISVIYQQNKGLTISNNIAISVAKGEFIVRLDADDRFDLNALSLLYGVFEKDEELGMAFGDWYEIDEFNNVLSVERRHDFEKEVSILDLPAHGACTMFRVEYLKELQGYDESLTRQDGYELWFRFIKKYKIKSLNIPIFYYRKHGSNLTSDETRLLNTRAKILEKHGKAQEGKKDILSIIPIRGSDIDQRSQPFTKVGEDFLIDFTIKEMLKLDRVRQVVITTPDTNVIDYVNEKYQDAKIMCLYRNPALARINTHLAETIKHVLSEYKNIDEINSFFISTIETPFKRKELLESAINIKNIFEVDTVVAVVPNKDVIFKHDGNGLINVTANQSMLKLEREQLHSYITGYTLCSVKKFLETNQIFGGKIGHINIDQKASFVIKSKLDIQIAEFLMSL